MNWRTYIPITEWLPQYNGAAFKRDLLAGITVCVILVPQGMAYAMLAGLPPVYGLYAGIIPLFLYAFFGTSRQLSVGPVALVSLLVLSGVSEFAEPGTDVFVSLAIITALLAGAVQIVLGFLKMGFLINFFSQPVISGFTSAAALIIGFSQLKNFSGIPIGRSNQIQNIISDAMGSWSQIHFPTLIIAVAGLISILAIKRVNKKLPAALIVVVIATIIVSFGGLTENGVSVVGEVPSGLPAFMIPAFNLQTIGKLIPLALTITLISFIESLAIAKTIQSRHKSYEVVPNQELIALGISKVVGAFFQAYPTTGSFTRSAINDEAGAQTGISSIVSAVLISLTLLFLTPLFYYLPNAILAAIIVAAVVKLVDFRSARYLWETDKRDFLTLITTFIVTLTIGVQQGVFAGVVLSLVMMIYYNSVPHIGVLGQLPGSKYYKNVDRFPEALIDKDMLIIRFDAQLYFGNAMYFRESIYRLVREKGDEIEALIMDASNIHNIDSSGIHAMEEVVGYLSDRDIDFYLSGAIGPVRDQLFKTGLMNKIGEEHQFLDLHDAVQSYRDDHKTSDSKWLGKATQTNLRKSST